MRLYAVIPSSMRYITHNYIVDTATIHEFVRALGVATGEPCYSLGFTTKRIVEACVRCTPIQGQVNTAPVHCTGSHDSRFAISKELRAEAHRQVPDRIPPALQQLCHPGHRLVLAKEDNASTSVESATADESAAVAVIQADECVNEADSKCDFEGLMQSLIQCV